MGDGLALVDQDGVMISQVATAPAGLPRIDVKLSTAGVGALRGCLQVLHGLPAGVSGQLDSIGADSLDGIWLQLKNGARVEWGSSSDTPHKAEVLQALLPQHATNYDLRSPDAPAVSNK